MQNKGINFHYSFSQIDLFNRLIDNVFISSNSYSMFLFINDMAKHIYSHKNKRFYPYICVFDQLILNLASIFLDWLHIYIFDNIILSLSHVDII